MPNENDIKCLAKEIYKDMINKWWEENCKIEKSLFSKDKSDSEGGSYIQKYKLREIDTISSVSFYVASRFYEDCKIIDDGVYL